MVIERTSKAEVMATVAMYGGNNLGELLLLDRTVDSVDAIWSWTPPEVVLVIDVCPSEKLVVSVSEILGNQQFQALGVDNVIATLARTADTCSLTLVLDLLRQILPVAIDTEAVATFHGKRLQASRIVTANVTHESVDDLQLRRTGNVLTKTSFVQNFLLLVHVLFDQTFLVPAHVTHEDGCCFVRLTEDIRHFFDLSVLLGLDVLWAVDRKVDLVGLLTRLQILVLGVEADVCVIIEFDIRVLGMHNQLTGSREVEDR